MQSSRVRKWSYKAVLKEVIVPHFLSARRRTYKLFIFIVLVRHLNFKYSMHIVWAKPLTPRYIILNAEGMNVSKSSFNNNPTPRICVITYIGPSQLIYWVSQQDRFLFLEKRNAWLTGQPTKTRYQSVVIN
jgi:hypothetical protein